MSPRRPMIARLLLTCLLSTALIGCSIMPPDVRIQPCLRLDQIPQRPLPGASPLSRQPSITELFRVTLLELEQLQGWADQVEPLLAACAVSQSEGAKVPASIFPSASPR